MGLDRSSGAFAPRVPVLTASVGMGRELSAALAEAARTPDRLVLVEAMLDPMDAPALLTQLGRATADAKHGGNT